MLRLGVRATFALAVLVSSLAPATAASNQWFGPSNPGRWVYDGGDQPRGGGCDIVVKRPGGNPTQDMTGSIGHAKSYQSNGGPARPRVCN